MLLVYVTLHYDKPKDIKTVLAISFSHKTSILENPLFEAHFLWERLGQVNQRLSGFYSSTTLFI
jgi:hypothetical protein